MADNSKNNKTTTLQLKPLTDGDIRSLRKRKQINGRVVAVLLSIFLYPSYIMHGQETTNTNCTTNGTNTNCTSTTTNNAAQQQKAYEAGQQIGNALGASIAVEMEAHKQKKWVKNYCAAHPGKGWKWSRRSDGLVLSSGHCPTDEELALDAVNTFMSKHKDFIKCEANSEVVVSYLETNHLSPMEDKSYERAYKDLKKAGKLQLFKN